MKLKYNNLPVYHDSRILPDRKNKEEGFWHLITKENNINRERCFNEHRARHLHWIKLLIENTDKDEVYPFEYGNYRRNVQTMYDNRLQ
ncbi:MAG TPA: hypothetical protein ENI15_14725 [Spirochaetes bacterium]|nr:hypothetical protein [Spirochaetota bacterium]